MGYAIKQSQTAVPLTFVMVDSSDHVTPKTGLTPTVTLSKNGAAFAAPAGAVSEIGSGWYKVAANATDSNTLGVLDLHATAGGADPQDEEFLVVAYDPFSWPANFAAMVISASGLVDANVAKVNGVGVDGAGTVGDPWGPV